MSDIVTYRMELSAEGGPSMNPDGHFDAEGYEKIEAIIPKNSVATRVNVQPSDITQLHAIIVLAQSYEDLTYTVDEGLTEKTLDGPLMLIGPGNIADHFGATANDLIFTNADATTDNMVTILVARTAIEPGA